MAKDVSTKLVSGSDNSENTTPSSVDQQKVPPLRIVLNTSASNHKSSSTKAPTASNEQQKGPLRYNAKKSNFLIANNQKTGSSKTNKVSQSETTTSATQNINKDEDTANSHLSSHLRRITRRSQRSIQTSGNEEEESMSSVTSADENPNANNGDNNIPSQDSTAAKRTEASSDNVTSSTTATTATTTTTSSTTASSTATNQNSDTPRRYKRRKCDLKESTTYDTEAIFNAQNYKPPVQNSFELYKSIRLQVEKKLESLHSVQPRTPHGFRDYMLNRGSYLLNGNKLGNGTNLFMNEDGGLNSKPVGKYHAYRQGKINYSVPNRAKVPLGLPVNSPLYNLFIEQEKERYRMRIQHIKEREKLTLATEQEIMRVYSQAARTAAAQNEPFSACTMLKHQEVYNYLDSDGQIIQSSDDLQQDSNKPSGSRSRRRHQQSQQNQQGSATPQRSNKDSEDQKSCEATTKADSKSPETSNETKNKDQTNESREDTFKKTEDEDSKKNAAETKSSQTAKADSDSPPSEQMIASEESISKIDEEDSKSATKDKEGKNIDRKKTSIMKDEISLGEPDDNAMDVSDEIKHDNKKIKDEPKEESETPKDDRKECEGKDDDQKTNESNGKDKMISEFKNDDKSALQVKDTHTAIATNELTTTSDADSRDVSSPNKEPVDDEMESQEEQGEGKVQDSNLSEDDKKAQVRESFLLQLQEIDDKWDKIRNEMLVRHRNEAESLYAVQKLEWEWKTKEIGACDTNASLCVALLSERGEPSHNLSVYIVAFRSLIDEILYKIGLRRHIDTQRDLPGNLSGRVAIVTGGTRGLGLSVVRALISKGCIVFVASSQTRDKFPKIIDNIYEGLPERNEETGIKRGTATLHTLDLSSMSSVDKFIEAFNETKLQLNYLICNAGIMFAPRQLTEDGFESHLAVNYLGHCLMIKAFMQKLKKTADKMNTNSRIICVSSSTHAITGFRFDDLLGESNYSSSQAYAQSKLAQIMFISRLSKVIKNEYKWNNLQCFSLHPGVVLSELYEHVRLIQYFPFLIPLIKLFTRDMVQGAETTLYATLSPELNDHSGEYLENCEFKVPSKHARNEDDQNRLWDMTDRIIEPWLKKHVE